MLTMGLYTSCTTHTSCERKARSTMGQGHKHRQISWEEQIITCNVQRGDPSTLTNLVQPLLKMYNLLSKRKKFPNATLLVRQFFFSRPTPRGGRRYENFSGFPNPPPPFRGIDLFCPLASGHPRRPTNHFVGTLSPSPSNHQ